MLLVDDSEPIRVRLLEMMSEIDGVHALGAASLEEARRAIQTEPPDLIVLDVRLPDGNGIDLLLAIRAGGLTMPVVMLTGAPSTGLRAACLNAGADFFLDKLTEFHRVPEIVEQLVPHRDRR